MKHLENSFRNHMSVIRVVNFSNLSCNCSKLFFTVVKKITYQNCRVLVAVVLLSFLFLDSIKVPTLEKNCGQVTSILVTVVFLSFFFLDSIKVENNNAGK